MAPLATGPGGSECPDLTLELDRGRWLIEGMDCALRFRVSAAGVDLSTLRVRVSTSFGDGGRWSFEMPECRLGAGRSRVVRLECAPPQGVRGLKVLRWDVSYTSADQLRRFEAQSEHSVYPSDLSVEALVGRLSIDIRQGDAGVVRLSDLYGDAIRSRVGTLRELVQEMADAPPVWEALDLWDRGEQSMVLSPPPAGALVRALTLRSGVRRVHLLAAQPVRIGRSRDCDLVTRCFGSDGRARELECMRISKLQACIERCADGVRYTDRSANGTFLDGQPVLRGSVLLAGGTEHTAALGGTTAATAPMSLHIRTVSCDYQARPGDCGFGDGCPLREAAGAVVRRSDGIDEVFVAVWCHVRLRHADPDLGALRVWRRQDAFGFRLGTQSGWLVPGMALDLGGGRQLQIAAISQQYLGEGMHNGRA